MASSQLGIVFLLACIVNGGLSSCPKGWFGTDCRYKCQCTNNLCFDDGSCKPPSRCEFGWFGPSCQYADVAAGAYAIVNYTETSTVITDGDDSTCFDYGNLQQMFMYLDAHYLIKWLRVRVKDPEALDTIEVKFRGVTTSIGRQTQMCSKKRTAKVDDYTMDIHCDVTVPIIHLILDGAGIGSLCSLHISGGRNVALKQPTSQSTIFTNSVHTLKSFKPSNGVDGIRATNIFHSSCISTLHSDLDPWWSVNFTRPYVVSRYVLYEREKGYASLKGFKLSSFSSSGNVVFQHQNNGNYQVKYVVIPNSRVLVKKVKIQRKPAALGFCEAEIFGETQCEDGKFGRDCECTCHCANNEPCFVSTGGCPSGCARGFIGSDCQERVNL